MISFIKMKENEWKLKAALYGAMLALLDGQKGAAGLLRRLYSALKDVSADELHEEFISKLAELSREETNIG